MRQTTENVPTTRNATSRQQRRKQALQILQDYQKATSCATIHVLDRHDSNDRQRNCKPLQHVFPICVLKKKPRLPERSKHWPNPGKQRRLGKQSAINHLILG